MICLSKVLGCTVSRFSCAAGTLTWKDTEAIFCQKVSVTHGAVTSDRLGGTNILPLRLQKLTVISEDKPKTHARKSNAHCEQCMFLLSFGLHWTSAALSDTLHLQLLTSIYSKDTPVCCVKCPATAGCPLRRQLKRSKRLQTCCKSGSQNCFSNQHPTC